MKQTGKKQITKPVLAAIIAALVLVLAGSVTAGWWVLVEQPAREAQAAQIAEQKQIRAKAAAAKAKAEAKKAAEAKAKAEAKKAAEAKKTAEAKAKTEQATQQAATAGTADTSGYNPDYPANSYTSNGYANGYAAPAPAPAAPAAAAPAPSGNTGWKSNPAATEWHPGGQYYEVDGNTYAQGNGLCGRFDFETGMDIQIPCP